MGRNLILSLFIALFLISCSSVSLTPADFAWPVEIVASADKDGNVFDKRYSLSFNIKPLFYEEFADSLVSEGQEIRLIRNTGGFYFITAKDFKNVYVLLMGDGSLNSINKILIDEDGISQPAFNQRNTYIELLTGKQALRLTEDGIEEFGDD